MNGPRTDSDVAVHFHSAWLTLKTVPGVRPVMTIDVVRVRTDRGSGNERDGDVPRRRNATVDVSEIPAERVAAYVERTVGDRYDEYYLERRGTKAFLTAVQEPQNERSDLDSGFDPDPNPDSGSDPDSPATPKELGGRGENPVPEWTYAVFATERTLQ